MTSRLEQPTAAQSPPPDEVAERPQPDVVAHRPRRGEVDAPSRPDGVAAPGSRGGAAAAQQRRDDGAAQDLLDDGATREVMDDGAAPKLLDDNAAQRTPADGAAQERPGAPRNRRRELWRTALATLLAAVITPVAVGIAANGAATSGRWWDTTDRWLSPAQSVLGVALLSVVAGLAAYEPAAAVIAGLAWGTLPAAVQITAPGQTYRLISSLPGLPTDLARALHTWLSSGVVLLIGVLLTGAGIAVALRRRGLPG
ncbi:hypothetical protein AB0H42_13205 [Nocardia sp. NPDC050799]|uniref:hypothetical protein n=1 Tax=Nocardia sp. NPDC050799 TaxID=3154842 RepID=UPI00340300E7